MRYKLISPIGNELSIIDYNKVKKNVKKNFSSNLIYEGGDHNSTLQSWKSGGRDFLLLYDRNFINISINEKFKEDFENKTKLKLEEIN